MAVSSVPTAPIAVGDTAGIGAATDSGTAGGPADSTLGGQGTAAAGSAPTFLQCMNSTPAAPTAVTPGAQPADDVSVTDPAAATNGTAGVPSLAANSLAAQLLGVLKGSLDAVKPGAPGRGTSAGAQTTTRPDSADSDADSTGATDPLLLVLAAMTQIGAMTAANGADAVSGDGSAGTMTTTSGGDQGSAVTQLASGPLAGLQVAQAATAADAFVARRGAERLTDGAVTGDGGTVAATQTAVAPDAQLASDAKGVHRGLLEMLRFELPVSAPGAGSSADATRASDAQTSTVGADSADATTAGALSSGMATASVGNAGTSAADPAVSTVSLPVTHPRWAQAVASEVRWFAEQGVQNATLKLTPEHLGPVEVHLALSDGQVNVNFSASHGDTRQALEQSLPQLRDMLAGAGLSLGQAHVQQQMRQGSQNSFSSGGVSADNVVHEPSATLPMRLGLVDEYA